MSRFEPRALRDAFGTFLTGVTVVTTVNDGGEPIGFTANSFSSVSLDPPLLLICLAKSSTNLETFRTAKGFAVNILSEKQQEISNTFARPVDDRFAAVSWRRGPQGSPVFEGVSAWFDCATDNIVDAGDHVILIGRVMAMETGVDNGLGYARGSYFTLGLERKAVAAASEAAGVVSAVVERDGQILLVEDGQGRHGLPRGQLEGAGGAIARMTKLIGEIGLEASIGFIFSVYRDRASGTEHVVYHCVAGEGTPRLGRFHDLDTLPLDRIGNPATESLLRRFAEESRMGQFGVYFGDESSGEVRRLTSED